jgi:heme A synthase
MFAIWFTAPRARFVLTVACGILVLVAHVIVFWRYTRSPIPGFARQLWRCSASVS